MPLDSLPYPAYLLFAVAKSKRGSGVHAHRCKIKRASETLRAGTASQWNGNLNAGIYASRRMPLTKQDRRDDQNDAVSSGSTASLQMSRNRPWPARSKNYSERCKVLSYPENPITKQSPSGISSRAFLLKKHSARSTPYAFQSKSRIAYSWTESSIIGTLPVRPQIEIFFQSTI